IDLLSPDFLEGGFPLGESGRWPRARLQKLPLRAFVCAATLRNSFRVRIESRVPLRSRIKSMSSSMYILLAAAQLCAHTIQMRAVRLDQPRTKCPSLVELGHLQ